MVIRRLLRDGQKLILNKKMKKLLNILFVWFLVIQSLGMDGRAIASIPMQDEFTCKAAIEVIRYNSVTRVQYNCVNAGYINS
jgi:hypothetical protein